MLLQLGFPESTFILVAMVGLVLVTLGIAALAGYAEHRKEMALIEAGQYEAVQSSGRAWVLAGGLLLTGFGLGSIVDGLAAGATGLPGVVPTFVGLAALAYYVVRRREDRRADEGARPLTE